MKKKSILKKVFAAAFASLFAFSAFACDKKGESGTGKTYGGIRDMGDFVLETLPREKYVPGETDIVLAENGKTDYSIVVPESVTTDIVQARDELLNFFEKSTGAKLAVISDTGLTFDKEKKYISLGSTTILQGSGMTFDFATYGEDGYSIKRFGNTLIIGGANDDGSMYGIYGFLEYNLGVKIYGETDFVIPKHDKLFLKDFDYTSIPDIKDRTMGISSANRYSVITEYRLGLSQDHGTNWITWCHTHFELLPPSKYIADHRDWYSHDSTQLCLTNDEMIEELIKVMKERILSRPDLVNGLFMLGHEDVGTFCECKRCKEVKAQYGGEPSSVMMLFINKIADAMNPWVEETFGGTKNYKWITFAYGPTVPAPVVRDEEGNYSPAHPDLVAHENVGVMIAPLSSDWGHSRLDGMHNERIKTCIEGWKVINPIIYTYTYNVVFDNELIFMDDWSYLKETFQIFEQMNTEYVFNDGTDWIGMPFFELRTYVGAKLMWDLSADVEALIDEFIDVYYKAAAPKVKEYFDLVRTRYRMIERELNEKDELFHMFSYVRNEPDLVSEEWWPKNWLLNAIRIYDEALALAEAMPEGEERETTIKRILAERNSPIYLLLELYRSTLTEEEWRGYIEDFKYACDVNSILYYAKHGEKYGQSIAEAIARWSYGLEE